MTSTPAAAPQARPSGHAPAPLPARRRHRRDGPGSPRHGVLALGALFLLVTTALAAAVLAHPSKPPFQRVDDVWLRWMGGPHDGPYAAVATVLDWFGGPPGVVVPLGLLIFLAVRKRRRSLLCLLTTYVVGNMLVVQALKFWVDRPRPADPLVRVDHGSFPSGHVAGTALLVVIVGALFIPVARRRAWWAAGMLLTGAMMWSRTWLHAHWLSDTLAGAMTGAGAALLLWWLFTPLLRREREHAQREQGTADGPTAHED